MPDRPHLPPEPANSADSAAPKPKRRLRRVVLWSISVLLAAAAAFLGFVLWWYAHLGDHVCTMIGTPKGISVDVDPLVAAQVTDATMITCWDGVCRPHRMELREWEGVRHVRPPTSGPSPMPGFVTIDDLPTKPVVVNLVFKDWQGDTLFNEQITITPELSYPNGPHCGAGGPQAHVIVHADGSLTPYRASR